jgi:hypothetical protein
MREMQFSEQQASKTKDEAVTLQNTVGVTLEQEGTCPQHPLYHRELSSGANKRTTITEKILPFTCEKVQVENRP